MALITLRQLLDHAAEHRYGVPAFNINNMEQGQAIMKAAKEVDSPVIIQVSRGARGYATDIMLAKMIEALARIYPTIPICMHQDHGNNEATCTDGGIGAPMASSTEAMNAAMSTFSRTRTPEPKSGG